LGGNEGLCGWGSKTKKKRKAWEHHERSTNTLLNEKKRTANSLSKFGCSNGIAVHMKVGLWGGKSGSWKNEIFH